ncbi:MAG TPA: hypothetical protein DEB25_02405 [Desulfobulbaceae bacterium]|nr:hypothetical protein [Desulfobulbaceae bacterium]
MKRLLAVILFTLLAASPAAAKIVRVAILPFDGSEAGEYAKLTDTLTSMLTSRVAAGGAVELVDRPFAASELNRLRGFDGRQLPANLPKMNADFVLKGSLYAVQSGMQLHLSVIPLDGKGEPGNFSAFAGAENQIIPAVEDLARSASTRLRGEVLPAEASPDDLAGEAVGTTGSAGFDTEHPDRIYQRLAAEGKDGGGTVAESGQVQAVTRRGEAMRLAANAMAVGDVDGDDKVELALVTDGSLRLFTLDDKMNGQALASYSFPPNIRVNMVSLAELDGQPGQEIYVSASQGTQPYGAIFIYRGGKLTARMKGIPWYIRPVEKPGEGVELLGQAGDDRSEMGYLGKGVHRLRPRPDFSALTDEGVVALPPGVGVFDFAWLDADGDGQLELAAIDNHSKLKIFNPRGELLWVSENEYGGGRNFIGPPLISDQSNNGQFRLLRYIPGRILVIDGDGDGRNEVIVSANKAGLLNTWLPNSREYDGGSLHHLVWDGSGMRESWKTGRLTGSIADYGISPPKSDNKKELQLVVAQRPGRTLLGFTLDDSTVPIGYRITPGPERATPVEKSKIGVKN